MRKPVWIGGLVGIAIVGLVLVIPVLATPDTRRAIEKTPADYGLDFQAVKFAPADTSADHPIEISAWVMPAKTPRAVAVIVHGHGANKAHRWSNFLDLAKRMVDRNITVISPDLRNHGQSSDSPEGISLGLYESRDVIGAVSFLKSRWPDLPVAVIGVSMGGAAILHAAANDPRIDAVVAMDALFDPEQSARNHMKRVSNVPPVLQDYILWNMETLQGIPVSKASILDQTGKLGHTPIMLIHNEGDPINHIAGAHKFKMAVPHAELWETPKPPPNHPYWDTASPAWGTHAAFYRIYPHLTSKRILRFLENAFAQAGR